MLHFLPVPTRCMIGKASGYLLNTEFWHQMKSPVYPASAQQQQTQFACWGFSVLRHVTLKNADCRSVLTQLYLFMNKTILDHRRDCTVHVVHDTQMVHRIHCTSCTVMDDGS